MNCGSSRDYVKRRVKGNRDIQKFSFLGSLISFSFFSMFVECQ